MIALKSCFEFVVIVSFYAVCFFLLHIFSDGGV